MVDFIVRRSGDDFECNIEIEGEIPQTARIELTDCDLHVVRETMDFGEPEMGMSTEFTIYDFPPTQEPGRFDQRLKKAGGESLGSVSILWHSGGERMRVNHFKISEEAEGRGLGTTLLLVAFGLAELAGSEEVHLWIGGGQDTVEWVINRGVPRELIDTTSTGNLSATLDFDAVDYDRSRVNVNRTG